MSMKNSNEPATFRVAAEYLNKLRHRVPAYEEQYPEYSMSGLGAASNILPLQFECRATAVIPFRFVSAASNDTLCVRVQLPAF
jgi:hypothetical protein